jgi:hypothetical protein
MAIVWPGCKEETLLQLSRGDGGVCAGRACPTIERHRMAPSVLRFATFSLTGSLIAAEPASRGYDFNHRIYIGDGNAWIMVFKDERKNLLQENVRRSDASVSFPEDHRHGTVVEVSASTAAMLRSIKR